jgi:hypothetical protein
MPLSFKTALGMVWVQPGDNQATGYNLKFGSRFSAQEKIEREKERQLLAWNEFPRVESPQTSATFPQALYIKSCSRKSVNGLLF